MVGVDLGGAQGREERLVLEMPIIVINSVVLAASLYFVLAIWFPGFYMCYLILEQSYEAITNMSTLSEVTCRKVK